jgi:hypothetical protein
MLEFCFSKVKKKNEKEYCDDAKNFLSSVFYLIDSFLPVSLRVFGVLKRLKCMLKNIKPYQSCEKVIFFEKKRLLLSDFLWKNYYNSRIIGGLCLKK